MSLLEHAKREFELAGYTNGEEINAMMVANVLELIKVFANQGHSGSSAPFCINLFVKLASFNILTPLTGEDSEWNDVSETYGNAAGTHFQNNRYSRVFKDNGRVYDIEAVVFENPDGSRYTSRDSCLDIKFPYLPKTQIRKVAE